MADSGSDVLDMIGSTDQPLPFDTPRLSNHLWLALATCEAIARNGGRVGGAQAASVLREWLETHRFYSLAGDSMKPLRDLAAGIPWELSGSATDDSRPAAMIRIAPLAFVLDAASDVDRALLAEVVSITCTEPSAIDDTLVMVRALHAAVEHDIVPDPRSLGDSLTPHPSLIAAMHSATSHSDDLEAALRAASTCDDPGVVRQLTGLLLGAAGCAIPEAMLAMVPERSALEAVIEPFAQLLSSVISQ